MQCGATCSIVSICQKCLQDKRSELQDSQITLFRGIVAMNSFR